MSLHPYIEFTSVAELFEAIESDHNPQDLSSSRYPMRFIFCDSYKTLNTIIKILSDNNVSVLLLDRLLTDKDAWFSIDDIINKINTLNSNTLIIPLSEILRFYNEIDFSVLLRSLTSIENKPFRIYIPLVKLWDKFNNLFYSKFNRKEHWAILWKIIDEPDPYSTIFQLTFQSRSITKGNIIDSTTDWLNIRQHNDLKNLICKSETLAYLCKQFLPDNAFTLVEITTPIEYIEKILNLSISIPYYEKENAFWDMLISDFENTGIKQQNEIIRHILNVDRIYTNNFIELWFKCQDEYQKWLLKNYILSNCHDCIYLCAVLQCLSDFSNANLLKNLWLKIFDTDYSQSTINERKELLKLCNKHLEVNLPINLENEVETKINALSDESIKLSLLTGILPFERKIILDSLIKSGFSNLQQFSDKHPELFWYLQPISFDNLNKNQNWIVQYLNEYKKAKLSNQYTSEICILINQYNSDEETFYKWYCNFPSVMELLQENPVDYIIWVDALGIEWISLIDNYISQNKPELCISKKMIARANLPSSTEFNRIEETCKIDNLDNLIHNNPYNYPESIFNQIDTIIDILEKNLNLTENNKIAIVSDHGLTALSRLTDAKKQTFKNVSHEGRYAPIEENRVQTDKDFIVHKTNDNKIFAIALKHNSIDRKPIREVHGGCTPEEVLVPVLVISQKTAIKDNYFNVNPVKFEVQKKIPELYINIKPKPELTPYIIDKSGNKAVLSFVSDTDNWFTSLEHLSSGIHLVKLKIGSFEIEITVEIKSGMKSNDLF